MDLIQNFKEMIKAFLKNTQPFSCVAYIGFKNWIQN